MKTLSIGVVIGASLASSVGNTFRSLDKSIGQIQQKSQTVKLGIAAGQQWKSLRGEAMKLSAQYQAGKLDPAGIQRFNELKKATAAAEAEARKYGLTVGDLNRQLGVMQTYSRHQDGFLARATARDTRRQERSEIRGQLTSTVAVGAAMFAFPLAAAMNFEQAMAEVGAISRSNAEEMAKLTENAREMGRTTKFSATEAAMGQKFLAMAGFDANEIVKTMPGMLDLAAASGMDLARTADIASNILTGFGMDASETTRVANVMALAFSSSNTNVEQLGYAMKYAAPLAKTLGFSIEETAAVVSKLSDAGIQGQMAGTTLRGMLDSLTSPTETASKILKELHVETIDKNGELRALPDIIKDLDAAMSKAGLGSAQRAGRIQDLFGTRAGTGANAIWDAVLSGDLETLTQKYINEQDGAVREMAERMNDTAKGALVKLGSALESVGIDIGNVLLPPIKDTAEALAAIVGKASAFLQKYPALTKTVVGLAAGFMSLKIAALGTRLGWSFVKDGGSIAMDIFQRLRPSVIQNSLEMARLAGNGSALKGMFTSLRGGAGSFAKGLTADLGALKTGLGAVFTPLTVGAALLAGAVFLAWRNWEDFSKVWIDGCAAMGKAWNEGRIGDAIMTGLATPLASVMVLLKDLGTLWNDFVNSFSIFNSREATSNAFTAVRERQAAGEYQSGDDMLGSAAAGAQYAVGGFINRPIVAQVGEAGPEYIIPVGSAYRERGRSLLGRAASALGLSVSEKEGLGASAPSNGVQGSATPGWADKLRALLPAPQPQMAMAGTGGGMNPVINIYPSPGMDENTLADRVIQKLEELESRRRRGAYADDAFFG